MGSIEINTNFADSFLHDGDYSNYESKLLDAHQKLQNKDGLGNEFLGWLDIDSLINNQIEEINMTADKIKNESDIVIVIGIGGSYIGSKSGIEFLKTSFFNEFSDTKIYFVGQNINGGYLKNVLKLCENKRVSVLVISKSGSTVETSIAFRFFNKFLNSKYGKEKAKNRIYVITDKENGILKKMSDLNGYKTFVIPDNVGGRFSVLTPVGLLPLAISGANIYNIIEGFKSAHKDYINCDKNNACYKYAVLRNLFLNKGKSVELFVAYDSDLKELLEWIKQLFAESEGKSGKGLFPVGILNSTDLHSLGQFIQDGSNIFFETVLNIVNDKDDLEVFSDQENLDNLNFLAGKSMSYINKKAMQATTISHINGDVPNIIIDIMEKNEFTFGYLVYFFMKSCAISAYMLGVNPFDQPGVEGYKKNMFALLEKPGFENIVNDLSEKMNMF